MTSRPRTGGEPLVNAEQARVFRDKLPLWKNHLSAEQTGFFPDRLGLQPDVLIRTPNMQPVVIETEFMPAASVEADATPVSARTNSSWSRLIFRDERVAKSQPFVGMRLGAVIETFRVVAKTVRVRRR